MLKEIDITEAAAAALQQRHIYLPAGRFWVSETARLEPPCSLQAGFQLLDGLIVGAFSYLWSPLVNIAGIGRYCSIGGGVRFGEAEHPTDWISTSSFTYDPNFIWGRFTAENGEFSVAWLPAGKKWQPIIIGNDVWIGTGAYIKGGVVVGDGAIIGTQAVVTRDVPPYAIAVGNPARVIRYRFDEETIARLLRLRWWRFSYVDFNGLDITDVDGFITGLERRIDDLSIREYLPQPVDISAL